MSKKVTFYFFAALVFLTSSVVGMNGEGTPKNKFQHPVTPRTNEYFTPEQLSIQEETAFNRTQAGRANGSESDKKEDKSSLEQRGGTVRIFESVHEGVTQQAGGEMQQGPRVLFQTPAPKIREERDIQSEPALRRAKVSQRDEIIFSRKLMAGGNEPLDIHELERLTWLGDAKEVNPFSQTKKELARWMAQKDAAGEKKLEEEIEDLQKIKAVRDSFVSTLEQCYGKDLTNELFTEGEKEKFLEQQEPLPLEDLTSLMARADALMEQGRSYLTECQKIEAPVQEALEALNITQEEAREAQEDYDELEGSPFQHFIVTIFCATRTAMGVVSTGTVIVLIVVYHQGIPIVMGVAASVAGFIIDPSNLHRFLGFLWIPDNFNNTRTSWRKFRAARAASSALDEKQK
ncbi:MAG: hypothetical protein WCO92_06460, partial [Verrucomicrobiota bacterium]